MTTKKSYWVGKKPSNSKRWASATSAEILEPAQYAENLLQMQRRYVKQWNDIELNLDRSLAEHTHEVHGATIVGGPGNKFILSFHNNTGLWILEINYARGFNEWHPGWSCGRNPFRNTDDIRSIHLHWAKAGREMFDEWLSGEKIANAQNGEWDEYKG